MNISVLACLVDVFVQFLPSVCGPKILLGLTKEERDRFVVLGLFHGCVLVEQ